MCRAKLSASPRSESRSPYIIRVLCKEKAGSPPRQKVSGSALRRACAAKRRAGSPLRRKVSGSALRWKISGRSDSPEIQSPQARFELPVALRPNALISTVLKAMCASITALISSRNFDASSGSGPSCVDLASRAHGGRAEGPPPAHPLWCRESATLAMPGRPSCIAAELRDHPLRTPCGVEKVPRLLCLDDRRA